MSIDTEWEEALLRRRSTRRSRIASADRSAPLRLSFGQQQMWFLNRLEPDSPEYVVPLILRLTGPLDHDALGEALNTLVARHEILRTRYEVAGTEPVQRIDPPSPVPVAFTDLGEGEGDQQTAMELAERETLKGIDLTSEWPLRVSLVRIAADDHLLVVVFHHIACDAWSLRVFEEELSALYAAPATPLAPLEIQYADYAAYQRDREETGGLDGQLAYWRDQLADLVPTEIPTDRPRPEIRGWHGAAFPVTLPDEVGAAVHDLAKRRDTTVFVVLLSAFQALLARYSGITDVAVGTVVSERNRPESQRMIGYGINSLVIRNRWHPSATFAELVAGAQGTVLDAFEHQDVPFPRLVDELEPERDRSRTPLFRVAFTMHEPKAGGVEIPGVSVESLEAPWQVAKFDLTLQIEETLDGSLRGQIEYATALFDEATVERMAGHLIKLLAQVTADPDAVVSTLDILGDQERELVIEPVRSRSAGDGRLHELFERQAAATPDAVAVVFDDERLTYAELNARANRLAHHLRDLGVLPDTLVGVCLERSTELVVTLLAVLKAGGAYLPLDPSYPLDRLSFMVSDAGARVVVTQSQHAELMRGAHAESVVVLERDHQAISERSAENPSAVGTPDDLIYVIYTSGSTGKPKGACLTHANVSRLFAVTREQFGFDASDVWPMFHSYAFDFSVWELWGALLYGGRLVVVPFDTARSPEDFLDLLVRERVTVLNQTPAAFHRLVRMAAAGDPRVARLDLRLVIFGGEKLEIPDLRPWVAVRGLENPLLVNMYGITETTVHVTHHAVVEADLEVGTDSPIGRPLDDLRIVLLDERGNVAPIGVPGEICVAGAGVCRGYLNRPALTAERFVPDPYGPPGSRLYRSGDMARRRVDGSLEYLGRIDDQVKIRGYRIELGEIQALLRADPRLRDAVVVAHDGRTLIAYVVPEGDAVEPAELQATLAESLPSYMVPAVFVPVPRIPLTTHGKVDRRALPAPDQSAFASSSAYVGPRTEAERTVAALWSEVLGVPKVGVHDNFFDLGGDSIKAVVLAGGMRDAGLDAAVADVFEHRTVAELAEELSGRETAVTARTLVQPFALISAQDRAKVPAGVVDAYPMSQLQTGMVVEMLADDKLNIYHNATSFRIRDDRPLSAPALEEATRMVVQRHEALRTSLDLTGYSVPMQLVHPQVEVRTPVMDLTGRTDAEQQAELRAFLTQERASLFDLAVPPLIRVSGHRCDDGVWWITITECHAVLEGWSYHSLLMEILGCYRRIVDGLEPEPYQTPAVRYADFIAAELAVLASAEERAYWRSIVSSHPPLTLPESFGDGADADWRAHRIHLPLDEWADGLRAVAASAGVSLKSVLLAAHIKVMSMLTDERSFFTGLVTHGRLEDPGADRVHGIYLNTLPFVFERGAATWRELVKRVFAQETELWSHRRFPMSEIQRDAGVDRLIDVRFSYLDFHQLDTDLVDLDAVIDDSPTEFGLAVHVLAGRLMITSNTRIVNEASVDRLAATYREVLTAIVTDPDGDALVERLPAADRERLLVTWNDTAVPLPDRTVCQRFEEQAAITPDAVALHHEGGSVTYAELDARAASFAHRLRELGAGPESAVAVLLDRSPDLLACLLGVWKAGAAYLPLDPSFPAQRIAGMIEDVGARLVVTEPQYADRFDAALTMVNVGTETLPAAPAVVSSADLDGLAYVIFTSGSTGRPKGVLITHRGLAGHVGWAADTLASHGTTGAPLFSSVAFDLVVPNLWAPLVTGQAVRLLPPDLDMADLGQTLVEHGPYSFIKLTPGHLEVLGAQISDEEAASLAEVLVVAGEALPGRTAREWLRKLGPGRLINEYGPTEASVGTCIYPVTEPEPTEVMPIGRPLPGMRMYVLDQDMRPVPIGVIGELYVGGTGVSRGYANRPGLTAERFAPDPFGPPGSRLYRTGDRAWVRADGAVCFAGRADDQVKIRGYRIELGEIRAVLLDHPSVRDAVVVERGSTSEDRRLVAYVVTSDGDVAGLAEHCATSLPDYMVPAAFAALERIPLNANGKVDRAALPEPDQRQATAEEVVGPRDALEEQIAQVWREVLNLEQVGVHDRFFDLGGHSIRAVAVVGRLRAAGLDVAVRDVFEFRTIAELAAAISSKAEPAIEERLVAPFELITPEDRTRIPEGVTDAYPLSQVQRGMVVEMLADQDLNNYHNTTSFLVRDDKPFSLEALRRAAQVVTERHEMLRTSIELTGYSAPLQLVHATAEIPVRMLDLRELDAQDRESAMRRFRARERMALFDLTRAPLLRITALLEDDRSWRLSFTQLHAVTEGWSFHSLLMEVVDSYHAFQDGREPERLDPPAVRYADFIAAELRSLESAEDRDYWRGIVTGYPKLTLPAAWAGDPAAPREEYHVFLSYADLEEELRALAAQAGASLKSVLLGAHLKVMSMITPEEAFACGLVSNARLEVEGAERVYGMHLNSLPFAHDRTATTWLELVEDSYARELELWPHRRFPMPAIQREMGDGGRLIDVLFTYQDFDMVDTELIDVEATEGDDSTEFALGVPCTPQFLILRSDTHVMTRANAERLKAMYRAVLESMAADPHGNAAAAYLPPGEEPRPAAVEVPVTLTLQEAFERQARETPDAIAVVAGKDRLSYAEVNLRANRLAHRLRGLGVGPESLVGVCLEHGIDLIPALLGVLKAGGSYVPLLPDNPAERQRFILADTGASVVVTVSAHASDFTGEVGEVILLDANQDEDLAGPDSDPEPVAVPGDLAYVIFTSGSTGRPKGVGVTHANVLRLFTALEGRTEFGADQTWALLHSYAFDVSVWEMWGALLFGGRVVVVPPAVAQSPADLLSLLEEQQVTSLSLSPVHFRAIIGAAGDDDARLSRLALRSVTFGGDRLEATDVARWVGSQGFERAALVHAYGPTETTVHVTHHTVRPEDLEGTEGVTIGPGVADMRVYVLDSRGNPVPYGVPGELCTGGPGVARGYVNRPGLTAERFVPDQWGPPGSRYYRTGDLVRSRPDGDLEFLGRIDDQIKVRGYRIEPGEIQTVLTEHPGVREAVVTAQGGGAEGKRLVAYCVLDAEAAPTGSELAAHCAARLPDYMVPVAYVPVESIPLTANGKLDLRALPSPDRASLWSSREFVEPRTPTERTLAGIWSQVLGVEQVGAQDRFFDLGGDSMMVLKAMSQARDAGLPVSLRMLYQHGSIGELAEAIDAAPVAEGGTTLSLTPGQREVLERDGDYRYDHHRARLLVPADVATEKVTAALRAVAARHEALRLRIDAQGRTAVLAGDAAVPLSEVDLSDDRSLLEGVVAEAGDQLDPEHGPMLSAVLARLGEDRPAEVILLVHELAMDRASWPVILDDLEAALSGELTPEPALEEWLGRLARLAACDELMDQAHYWLTRMPHPALPVDRPGTNTVASGRVITSELDREVSEPVLIAALAGVLSRWTGGDRVLLDVETRPQGAPVGPFTQRYPLAVWLPPRGVLKSVTEQLRAVPDEGIGFGLLRYGNADLGQTLADLDTPEVRFGHGRSATVRDPFAAREHLLEVDTVAEEGRLHITWTYSSAVHDEATIRRLADELVAELTESGIPSPLAVMERDHVPGLSVALIRDGEITSVQAYGRLDARIADPVTPDTVFRVASVSKQITALGALRLASEGRLDLDADVNSLLTSWQLPGTVTVKQLLANTAGLAKEAPFEPYVHDGPVPTVLEALLGAPPARTPAVRPEHPAGEVFEKNVNNYLILEQLIVDVIGTGFDQAMRETVFEPLGMTSSSFDPTFPHQKSRQYARGHDAQGLPLAALGPAHPASAAGGLWTTAGDLARAQLELRRAHLGKSSFLTRELAEQMLTPTPGTLYGLSTIVDFPDGDVDFGAVGEFSGYWAMAMCRVRRGDGFVLLTNGDGGRRLADFLVEVTGGNDRFGR